MPAAYNYSVETIERERAKPGDTIEITNAHQSFLGKRYVVIEPPVDAVYPNGSAWTAADDANPKGYFIFYNYKVVKRADKKWLAYHNGCVTGNVDVDESLKRQLNDNLRGVFT